MNPSPASAQARVFFALWPNDEERAALAAWQVPLLNACGGRAMRTDTLHSTLVFLGEIERTRLEALRLAAHEIDGACFELSFEVARYWGHNHIAYAAPTHIPLELPRLVQQLEQSLRRHHFRFDLREFKPHATLLRHAVWSDAPLPEMTRVSWQCKEFVLVESQQNAQGAHYQVLEHFPLR